MTLSVLLNPESGGAGSDAARRLAESLEAAGVEADVEACDPAALAGRAREVVARGAPRVAVAGGDGTLRSAAQVLADGGAALGVVPTGRRNHFARRLGLPDLESAALALARGRVEEVALGSVSDEVFLNTATVGAYGDVVRLRERVRPVLGTWGGTVVGWSVLWARWPVREVRLRTDDGEYVRSVPVVWAGTGPETFPAPHRAPLPRRGDRLQIVLPPTGGRAAALRVVPRLLRRAVGRHARLEEVLEVLRPIRAEIDGRGRLAVTLDGEPLEVEAPALLALGRHTLRVVVPDPGRREAPAGH